MLLEIADGEGNMEVAMKGLTFAIALLGLGSATSAQAEAANLKSKSWLCKANEAYSCAEGRSCRFIAAQVFKVVNFEELTVSDFGSEIKSEISNIKYSNSRFSSPATYFTSSYS